MPGSLGIPVLFYISPQVWAWRPKRIHKIGSLIDHMAVIFKFEKKYYEDAGYSRQLCRASAG